jgi:hypothetical protein
MVGVDVVIAHAGAVNVQEVQQHRHGSAAHDSRDTLADGGADSGAVSRMMER